ncbi:hypothetical protein Ahy_B01g056256 isoform H [Arachis hypogaea]|uniref:MobA-like NTP transferase domain-containing protein n=1 Tax=Arachis hypogaea TaxID=3818 RepID=A0A445AYE1_ARAHY|nr:hypothetical protein Ahy_B01g056256 isoform H [Arachis hypogaea]
MKNIKFLWPKMKLPKKIHRVTSSRLLCVLSESLRCLLLSPELIGASSAIASFQRFKLPPSRTNASIAKSTVTLCSTQSQSQTPQELYIVKEKSVSVVLLAGGQGKRMGANMPKQYLPLLGQPIALYSFYTFSRMVEVKEIIVVCDPSYKDIFEGRRELTYDQQKVTMTHPKRSDDPLFQGHTVQSTINKPADSIYDFAIYVMKWLEIIQPENVKKGKYEWDNWTQSPKLKQKTGKQKVKNKKWKPKI